MKMYEDPIGATGPQGLILPKKRGRKPKVILDPSDTMISSKTKTPKGLELTSTIEVPEKVI